MSYILSVLLIAISLVSLPGNVLAGGHIERRVQQERIIQQQIQQEAIRRRQIAIQQQQQQVIAQRQAQIRAEAVARQRIAYQQQVQQARYNYAQQVAQKRAYEVAQYQRIQQEYAARQQAAQAAHVAKYRQAQHYAQNLAAAKTVNARNQFLAYQHVKGERELREYQAYQQAKAVAHRTANEYALEQEQMEFEKTNMVEDVVDINDLWRALDDRAEAWDLIIDQEIKMITIAEYKRRYREQNVMIEKTPEQYVAMIDSMAVHKPNFLNMPMADILKMVAIIEYDFDNGQDKEQLARQVFPTEQAYLANKKRLGR